MFLSVRQLALVSVVLPSLAVATGTTEVTCNVPALQWSFNNENVSPCQVGANLGAVCSSTGDYDIPVLSPPVSQNFYTPSLKPTPCECSTVLYNLAAACGLCQGGIVSTWLFWQTNCTSISPGTFPFDIPPNTNVPHWAFLDPRPSNKFDPTAAQQAGDAPESTSTATQTAVGGGGASSGAPKQTGITNPPPSSSQPANTSSKKSGTNAGAIAGGVVGGVLALGIIGGLLFYFLRRNASNNRNAPSTSAGASQYGVPMGQTHYENNQPYGMTPSPYPESGSQYPQPSLGSQQRPYDPNDPSTFPNSPNSFGGASMPQSMHDLHSTHSPPPPSLPGYATNQSQHGSTMTPLGARPGGYSGVAEI